MTSTQEEVILTRDVIATLIPHGEEFTLGSGEKVTITHRLGGNFTVMTLQGMYRIAARDADALGEANKLSDEKNVPKGGKPADEDDQKLKSFRSTVWLMKTTIYQIKIAEVKSRTSCVR